jgi:hypothetical protein
LPWWPYIEGWNLARVHGGLENSKTSGVGTNFGLLVHKLPGPNKQREAKPSILLSRARGLNN